MNVVKIQGVIETEWNLSALIVERTLVGHFVSSPRERAKIDRSDSRGDEREGQGKKRNRNGSEILTLL